MSIEISYQFRLQVTPEVLALFAKADRIYFLGVYARELDNNRMSDDGCPNHVEER